MMTENVIRSENLAEPAARCLERQLRHASTLDTNRRQDPSRSNSLDQHSWHAILYVTPRGLTTGSIYCETRAFQIYFDFIGMTRPVN